MILVDFNQVVIAAIAGQVGYDGKRGTGEVNEDFIRHLVINMLRSYRKQYHAEYGELVICCDDGNYWRKVFFPQYKANRKKERGESALDWQVIFDSIKLLRDEINDNFPYPVIRVSRCEADDVIATICKWSQSNELKQTGVIEEPQPILIISTDGDLIQLQKYSNVQQFTPRDKKMVTFPTGMNADKFILEHIIEGDTSDGVPNALSADNCLVDKIRQKPLTQARRAGFMENGIDGCLTDDERTYFQRNTKLVDLSQIPAYIEDLILDMWQQKLSYARALGRRKVFNYLIKHRMAELQKVLNDF